jgi:hypothetical protein
MDGRERGREGEGKEKKKRKERNSQGLSGPEATVTFWM